MELKLRSDVKRRKQFFTGVSFSHPAKMALGLQEWLVETYSKPGDTILDPMAGSGTVLIGALMGRHIICVELEPKFVKMCEDNWAKIQTMPLYLGTEKRGWAIIKQGDARNLEGILADCIITSPPYAETIGRDAKYYEDIDTENKRRALGMYGKQLPSYSANPDLIISSPPYAEAHDSKDLGVGDRDRADLRDYSYLKSDTEGQIGNLPYGNPDLIITSPPYSGYVSVHTDEYLAKSFDKLCKMGYKINPNSADNKVRGRNYSDNPDNIGNLPHGDIDCVITSPPYQKGSGNLGERKGVVVPSDRYPTSISYRKRGWLSSQSELERWRETTNIGNLKSDTYLASMKIVYSQCFKVLKPNGLMVLVVKPFIRNKAIVPLDEHTVKLCEAVGFILKERHHRLLTAQSFWRTIYKRKFPDAPMIDREHILVFRKQ